MRLICPNCAAQYEVPVAVIPEAGRDVQCSSCQHTWFQHHPDHPPEPQAEALPPPAPDLTPVPDPLPDPEPEPEPARPRIDPDMAELFREEREYETRRRAAEVGSLESQPDLGLTPSPRPQPPSDVAQPPEDVPTPAEQAAANTAVIASAAAVQPRRDRLPDVEEINQTLRSTTQPRAVDLAERRPVEDFDEPAEQRNGFVRGFALIVILAALAIGLYTAAPRLSAAVPALQDPLSHYVAALDGTRAWLDGQVLEVLELLDGMSSEANSDT